LGGLLRQFEGEDREQGRVLGEGAVSPSTAPSPLARGPGGALQAPPTGFGAEPQPQIHFWTY